MNQEKIGKFILKCRKNKNLTQQELAERLGVTDRTIGNWENGRNMPDLALFKPLCTELDISINDLLSGEKVIEEDYSKKLEENMINTILYSNQKIENRNKLIGIIFIIFGCLISLTAISIFPSESSWGSIYSIFGIFVSLIGVVCITRKLNIIKRLLLIFSYSIILALILYGIDYIGVVNIGQAPRFAYLTEYGSDNIYYNTLLYDVIRCNTDKKNEKFVVVNNKEYSEQEIINLCD